MPGITKRKCDTERNRIAKELKKRLYQVVETLPPRYSRQELLNSFKKFFPLEWSRIVERCEYYKQKDLFLLKLAKKERYRQGTPEEFFFRLPIVKYILSNGYINKHLTNFNDLSRKECTNKLIKQKDLYLLRHNEKTNKYKAKMQKIDPYYLEALIAAYHQRGNSINDKMEIVQECKKFDSPRIFNFFYRLNDSERNDQIRNIAFMHLQKSGHYVKLRKKFKGNRKQYMIEETDFEVTPADLYRRLQRDSIQNKKVFDVFISHSYKDGQIISKIISIMNKNDLHCYCDWVSDNDFLKRSLVSDYTAEVLKKRIEQSKKILFVQTENSVNGTEIASSWIQMELEHGTKIGKKIYQLNLSSSKSSLPYEQININFNEATIMWE